MPINEERSTGLQFTAATTPAKLTNGKMNHISSEKFTAYRAQPTKGCCLKRWENVWKYSQIHAIPRVGGQTTPQSAK
jgi:hypothetical protein